MQTEKARLIKYINTFDKAIQLKVWVNFFVNSKTHVIGFYIKKGVRGSVFDMRNYKCKPLVWDTFSKDYLQCELKSDSTFISAVICSYYMPPDQYYLIESLKGTQGLSVINSRDTVIYSYRYNIIIKVST